MRFSPKPYSRIKGHFFKGTTTIHIKPASFAGHQYQDGKATFFFENCVFENMVIENPEEICFEDISILLMDCHIYHVHDCLINSQNISIHVFNSVINGVIESENLRVVEVNNCVLNTGLFIQKVQKVFLNFTAENLRVADKDIAKNLQRYYFTDCERIDVRCNFTEAEYALFPNLALSIDYGDGTHYGETNIADLQLQTLTLQGKPLSQVSIVNTLITEWYIFKFLPQVEVSFYNIGPKNTEDVIKKIEIHECILDKVWFDNINFDEYQLISFFRTRFSGATFSSCNFPRLYSRFDKKMTTLQNANYPDRQNPNRDKDLYEMFLQLKMSLEKTGNYYEAQKLQAVAHDALAQIKNMSKADKWILCINRHSNKHGLSIKEPLLGFLIFTIPLYLLYLWSIGRLFQWDGEIDWHLTGYYFAFIDLTHKSDFLGSVIHLNFFSFAIDYLGKIVVSFFIYQFVAAFRKYGKKM